MPSSPIRVQVPEAQNDPKNLDFLAAASHLYGGAKLIAGVQFALTVPVAIGCYIVVYRNPELKPWTTFVALSSALLDVLLFERLQSNWRRSGALAQERFDCNVLQLAWNKFLCRQELEPAAIARAAKQHRRYNRDLTHHQNWYPIVASQVDPASGTLICQRSSVRWDSVQRRRYSHWLLGIGVGVVFTLIALGLKQNYSTRDFVLGLYAPLAPAILWVVREALKQRDAAARLEALRSSMDNAWDARATRRSPEMFPSRALQDAIFDARCRNVLVFDWIYWLQRSENEDAMRINAEDMVRTIKALN